MSYQAIAIKIMSYQAIAIKIMSYQAIAIADGQTNRPTNQPTDIVAYRAPIAAKNEISTDRPTDHVVNVIDVVHGNHINHITSSTSSTFSALSMSSTDRRTDQQTNQPTDGHCHV